MTFPSMPTDSLYKFMAIAGLVAVVTANYWNAQEREEFDKEGEAYIWQLVDGVRKDHPEKAERSRELNSLDGHLKERLKLKANMLKERLAELAVLETVGYVVGLIGFCGWWFNIQRYQNILLRLEVQKALKETPLEPPQWWTYLSSWFPKRSAKPLSKGK